MVGYDLFAGAGGMSLGATWAGIKVALAVEIDPLATKTYSANHLGTNVFNGDIRKLTIASIKSLRPKKGKTIIFGGPPCQGFSYSNQRTRSADNPDSWLFTEFLRVVRVLRPDWVVFENVRGIVNTAEGLFVTEVVRRLEKTFKYCVSFGLLNALDYGVPRNELDLRISDNVMYQQTCDGGQGCRYGGWINPYLFDKKEFDDRKTFMIPRVGRIVPGHELDQPIHGGTCSPWAGLMLGWYLCANSDYNFRIGRSAYTIANFDHDEVYKNSTIPGYGDYCEVEGKRRLEHIPLNAMYQWWEWLNKVNFVELDHHCFLILKVGGDGLYLEDPHKPGFALPPGLYRWAADGYYPRKDVDGDGKPEKYYSGTKQTFRRIEATERCTQGWDIYRVADVDPSTCSPVDGPWAGREAWPMILET